MRGEIAALGTVVIPPNNTPMKLNTESLVAIPHWSYKGPGETINLEWQVGRWGIGFAGDTERKYCTFSQPASSEFAVFNAKLPAISLSPLAVRDEPYDAEIVFKDKFADLRVIVENCVKIVATKARAVSVTIKNPPPLPPPRWDPEGGDWIIAKALLWNLSIFGYDYRGYPHEATREGVAITQKITFDTSGLWPWDTATFPMPFSLYIYTDTGDKVLWVQSWYPEYSGISTYIPGLGIPSWDDYYFNCATNQFERV